MHSVSAAITLGTRKKNRAVLGPWFIYRGDISLSDHNPTTKKAAMAHHAWGLQGQGHVAWVWKGLVILI